MIIIDGTMGRMVPVTGTYGVIPANFASEGTSPSPLANDADLPADANTEWMWMLLSPLPGAGTTQVNDLGGYAFFGAPDGVYTQAYRGFTVSPSGVVVVYDTTITTTISEPRTPVQQDRNIAYAVIQGIVQDLAINYVMRARVTQDRSITYPVSNAVFRDLAIAWALDRQKVENDLLLAWGILNQVMADAGIRYFLRSGVQKDAPLYFNVESSLVPPRRRFKITIQPYFRINTKD